MLLVFSNSLPDESAKDLPKFGLAEIVERREKFRVLGLRSPDQVSEIRRGSDRRRRFDTVGSEKVYAGKILG